MSERPLADWAKDLFEAADAHCFVNLGENLVSNSTGGSAEDRLRAVLSYLKDTT